MVAIEFQAQLKGYGLTTAHILYRLPDYPRLLQEFIWQHYDMAPDYPALFGFLEFWDREIEGPVHAVRVAHRRLIGPAEWRNARLAGAMH